MAWGQNCSRTSVGFTPFSNPYAALYQNQQVSLYPAGNQRPAAFDTLGRQQAAAITPLNLAGNPDPNGKIVLLSVGMSNTTQEFSAFIPLAAADPQRNPRVQAVDGAISGVTAAAIATQPEQYWPQVQARLQAASASADQVQAIWLKEADANPTAAFPNDATKLQSELETVVLQARAQFPNLKIIYFSSRIYGGYATSTLNPEPFAYQTGFADKWLIAQQINGAPELDVASGKAPWLSWGPYLWADGLTPRFDGLTWACSELQSDGTHPSPTGQSKVARMLLDFFHSDATARPWYLAQTASTPTPEINAVVDSAGYGTAIAAGLVATIFGSNLASYAASASAFPLPHELAGTQVLVNGVPALLYYVSPTQINFIVPVEGGQSLVVARGQTSSALQAVQIGFWAPGFFTMDSVPGGPAAAEHADGTIISPTNPARHGETIQVFGTGLGVMNPLLAIPIAAPFLQVGGKTAQFTYFGNAPGIPGVSQINLTIPADAPAGPAVPIMLQLGGAGSNTATLAVAVN
jgi:uncharacterized protein (TIGR03437 family)